MAVLPNPEETGRVLLAIFGRFNIRPDQMLMFNSLHPGFLNAGGNAADYDAGIDWLETSGFIDRRGKGRGPDFLTEAGFAEIWTSAILSHPDKRKGGNRTIAALMPLARLASS